MPINILMPALSPTMEKGNLAKWLKKEGDKVKSGDVIAEIETDKATMEVEAVDEGTIAKILVPEGTQDVPVNDIIAVLAGDGEDVKAARQERGPRPHRKPPKPRSPLLRLRQRPRRRHKRPQQHPHRRLRLPLHLPRPMATRASSRRRSPVVSPRKPASTSRASTAPARMAASSPATSRAPSRARA